MSSCFRLICNSVCVCYGIILLYISLYGWSCASFRYEYVTIMYLWSYVLFPPSLLHTCCFYDHLHCIPLICCWQKGEKYLGSYMIILPLSIVLYLLYICLIIWWMFVITKKGEIDEPLFWWWLTNHPCGTNRVFWVCYRYIKRYKYIKQVCYKDRFWTDTHRAWSKYSKSKQVHTR
jgi:hypothetical protein